MMGKELRNLSVEELRTRENELRRELFELKVRHQTSVVSSTARLKTLRRTLARVLTIRQEKADLSKNEG